MQAVWNVDPIDPSDVPTIGADAQSQSTTVDFYSTVHLTDMLVTDSNGKPIPGVSIQSDSGFQYPLDPFDSAPEPGRMGAVGVAALLLIRRRRAS